jgi:hypothetical protein
MQTRYELRGSRMLAELGEFASFSAETQRYICRSLEGAFEVEESTDHWARDERELDAIRLQRQVYAALLKIRFSIPKDDQSVQGEAFLLPLIEATAFDISSSRLASFRPYRFLYERLLGARIRPWLASAFLAAVGLPYFPAAVRKSLVATLEGALVDDWSPTEPVYWPRWLGDSTMLAA